MRIELEVTYPGGEVAEVAASSIEIGAWEREHKEPFLPHLQAGYIGWAPWLAWYSTTRRATEPEVRALSMNEWLAKVETVMPKELPADEAADPTGGETAPLSEESPLSPSTSE